MMQGCRVIRFRRKISATERLNNWLNAACIVVNILCILVCVFSLFCFLLPA